MSGFDMVTTGFYSITKDKVFLETSDSLIIKMSPSQFKKDYPTATRKRLLQKELRRMLMMQNKSKKAGLKSIEKRQSVIIKKLRMLMR
jgi:hypothetical protein